MGHPSASLEGRVLRSGGQPSFLLLPQQSEPQREIQHFNSMRILCDGAFAPILISCTDASFQVAVPKVR